MKYKVEFLTGTNNRNFYKDLEEIISMMEHKNKKFSKHTVLKCVVRIPNSDSMLEPGTFTQMFEKYGCDTYECKGNGELMVIDYEGFKGSCLVEVKDEYLNARKTTILSVQEIVVTGPTYPRKVVRYKSKLEENWTLLGSKLLKKIFNFLTHLKWPITLH